MKKLETLKLRHGEVGLDFLLYPPDGGEFLAMPLEKPRFYRQYLFVQSREAYKSKEEMDEGKDVLPYRGVVFFPDTFAWQVCKNLQLWLEDPTHEFNLYFKEEFEGEDEVSIKNLNKEQERLVVMVVEGTNKEGITKRSRIVMGRDEVMSFVRYLKLYGRMEMDLKGIRLFRWSSEYMFFLSPFINIIYDTKRDEMLESLRDFLKNKSAKAVNVGNRYILRLDRESKELILKPSSMPAVFLTEEDIRELYLFLKG